jgi:hypothetical protein
MTDRTLRKIDTQFMEYLLHELGRIKAALEAASYLNQEQMDKVCSAVNSLTRIAELAPSPSPNTVATWTATTHGGIDFRSEQERNDWVKIAAAVAMSLEPMEWEQDERAPDGRLYGLDVLEYHVQRITLVADEMLREIRDRDAKRGKSS